MNRSFNFLAIRMVAKNDNNKRTVYTCGAVPLLVELANQPGVAEEQRGRMPYKVVHNTTGR